MVWTAWCGFRVWKGTKSDFLDTESRMLMLFPINAALLLLTHPAFQPTPISTTRRKISLAAEIGHFGNALFPYYFYPYFLIYYRISNRKSPKNAHRMGRPY